MITRPFTHRPIVYLAMAYTSDPVLNTHDAIEIADGLQATELVTVYVPHLNHLWGLVRPHMPDYWLSYDLAFLQRSHALLRIEGESPGADNEVVYAGELGIPVFHDESDLLEWARNEIGG